MISQTFSVNSIFQSSTPGYSHTQKRNETTSPNHLPSDGTTDHHFLLRDDNTCCAVCLAIGLYWKPAKSSICDLVGNRGVWDLVRNSRCNCFWRAELHTQPATSNRNYSRHTCISSGHSTFVFWSNRIWGNKHIYYSIFLSRHIARRNLVDIFSEQANNRTSRGWQDARSPSTTPLIQTNQASVIAETLDDTILP